MRMEIFIYGNKNQLLLDVKYVNVEKLMEEKTTHKSISRLHWLLRFDNLQLIIRLKIYKIIYNLDP